MQRRGARLPAPRLVRPFEPRRGSDCLNVCDVSKSYSGRVALRNLSMPLQSGATALLGRNGSGKSTLMRLLATVENPDSGQLVHCDGLLVPSRARRAYRAQLGWLPQQFDYPGSRTARQYVSYVAWLKALPRSTRSAAVASALDQVGLTERADDRLSTLSGGMLRRAGLAQAIVNDPGVLLLDEPTTGLDPEQRAHLAEVIRRRSQSGIVLVATHLLEDVALMADRVAVVDSGSLVFQGSFCDFAGVERVHATVEGLTARFAELVPARDRTR